MVNNFVIKKNQNKSYNENQTDHDLGRPRTCSSMCL